MEELIPTLQEEGEERIDTLQEGSIIAGVQTINGKAGDLDLKTINGQDILTPGNLSLATTEQLATKQDVLTETQLAAVDSGIDSSKVQQIADNTTAITGKQDQLTQTQLNAVNSGIDQTKVAQIATNTGNITSNTSRITTIEGKIPSAATSTNQLTDKNYVDNSIATNTANYISDNGQPFQSLADLEAYSGPLTNNDYAFVVSTDSAGNLLYTRYKYNADQELWAEEYTIANPTFTSTQWAAIDSGVTANDVAQIGTNKSDIASLQSGKQDKLTTAQQAAVDSGIDVTKVQQIATNAGNITSLQTDKQDKLIAGTNIQIAADGKTISATDTTYTAGTGLTLTGTQFSVTEPVPNGFFTDTAATQEGTGTTITLNNTVDAPIDNVELKGDTFQQTYSGKNLLPPPADFTENINGLEIKCTNGEWAFSGTPTSGQMTVQNVIAPYTIQPGDYFHYNNTLVSSRINIALTFTDNTIFANSMNSENRIISLVNYVGKTIASVKANFNNGYEYTGTAKPMILNNVSTVTSFEPYVGGVPSPNPDYPQDIQVVTGEQTVVVSDGSSNSQSYDVNLGKNLWGGFASSVPRTGLDISFVNNADGTISVTSGTASVQHISLLTSLAVSNNHYITLKAGSYVVSGGTANIGLQVLDTSGVLLGTSTFTLTTEKQVYIRAVVESGVTVTATTINPQLELGSTATSYAPYFTPIELCKIGTYQDYIWKDGDDWKIHKAVGKTALDGTEAWTITNISTTGTVDSYRLSPWGAGQDTSIPYQFYCSHFKPKTNWRQEIVGMAVGSAIIATTQDNLNGDSNLTTWASWLATTKPSIYYILATPTDTTITDATLIAQLEALGSSTTYSLQTNYTTSTVSPNLPVILTIDVFKNNYAGLLARLNKAGA